MPRAEFVLAGAAPGAAAGLSVMTATLLAALRPHGELELLTHDIAPIPYARRNGLTGLPTISLGVQPLCVHGEAALAARLHVREFRAFVCGWAVGSRYAEALRAARLPYLIWEATTLRDEIATTSVAAVRRSGRGSGVGTILHKMLLPFDELLERRLYRNATAVLAMSEYTAQQIRTLHELDESHVRVLSPPPTPRFLAGLERARTEAAWSNDRTAGTSDKTVRFLFVGRVDDPRKNFRLLRDAFLSVRDTGTPVELTVVGPHGANWRRSLHLPNESGITFAGSLDHDALPRAFLDHDVLVVPSRQEGFGIVVSEAMHAGLAVISTRCGGPEHVLRESGGGVLVDHTPNAMAEAIRALAGDAARRSKMGACGREYAQRELSTERFNERVGQELAALREVARSRAHT
jgi:glycosyltransferase involved in cell wall biosynthesis